MFPAIIFKGDEVPIICWHPISQMLFYFWTYANEYQDFKAYRVKQNKACHIHLN